MVYELNKTKVNTIKNQENPTLMAQKALRQKNNRL